MNIPFFCNSCGEPQGEVEVVFDGVKMVVPKLPEPCAFCGHHHEPADLDEVFIEAAQRAREEPDHGEDTNTGQQHIPGFD